MVSNELIGWAKDNFVEKLTEFTSVFKVTDSQFTFVDELTNETLRTNAIAPVIEKLHQQGIIESWVDETYAITNTFGDKTLFQYGKSGSFLILGLDLTVCISMVL